MRALIKSINPKLAAKCEVGKNRWVIPHGSISLEIRLDDAAGWLELRAPFVQLAPEPGAAPLRLALELNTYNLRLPKLTPEGNRLVFQYRVPIDLTEPVKIYGIISDICLTGDSYDDEYITKFGAMAIGEKKTTPLSSARMEKAWNIFSSILAEAKQYSDYFASRRQPGYNLEIQGIALFRIDHALCPQGYLRTRLERSVGHLWDNRPVEEIITIISGELDEYRRMPREELERNLYQAAFFVAAKKNAEMQTCQKHITRRWEWAQEDRANGSFQGLVLCYLFAAYDLLYRFFLPPKLEKELTSTLADMAGQSWENAGKLAWNSFQKIMSPSYA